MRSLLCASSMVLVVAGSALNAQIRTPIATVSDPTTTPGPAPLNAKAVATSPTSVTVSWDAVSGARAYTVDRARTDDPNCCVAHSGLITTPSWTDGSLEPTKEYSFVITALYFDGRVGSTEMIAATPAVALPAVRLPRDVQLLSAAEGILRYTPCGQRSSGGPGPATITPTAGTPAGGVFSWSTVPGTGMNYVVERAPESNTSSWTFVGSTCGGPSSIGVSQDVAGVRDYAGGVSGGVRYVYRVTAVSSNGAAGWNTYHWSPPCQYSPRLSSSVSGSTVTIWWNESGGSACNYSVMPVYSADSYTLSSEFGFTKTRKLYGWSKEVIYGVSVGTHRFTMVGKWANGGSTIPTSIDVTVAY